MRESSTFREGGFFSTRLINVIISLKEVLRFM